MATYRDPAHYMMALEDRFKTFTGKAKDGWIQAVRESEQDFKENASGGTSLAQLRRMGHPFRRSASGTATKTSAKGKRIKGRLKLLPINKQRGKLLSSTRIRFSFGKTNARLQSRTKYWKFLRDGTKKMLSRPMAARVIKPRFKARIKGLKSALRKRKRT